MILNDYNKIINEYFDLVDTPTRKCIVALEDSEQSQMLSALSSALYDKIVEKVDKIDFGTIPRSRGDITKVDGYENTIECLRIIHRLVEEYHQDPTIVDDILGAIENIKERKAVFMKAFALGIEFPMVLYNLVVAAIENSVSFLISVCIQYIKDPETNDIAVAIDRVAYHNAKSNMLYEQIVAFNSSCADGSLDQSIAMIMKNGRKVAEAFEAGYEFDGKQDGRIVFDNPEDVNPYATREPFEDPKDVPDPLASAVHEEEPTDNTGFEVEPGFAPSLDNVSADDYELDRRDITNEFGVGATIGVFAGGLALTMTALKSIISIVIPFMRNIAYFLISGVGKISTALSAQADFVEMNAHKLQASDDYATNPKQMQRIVTKQRGIAEKLKKWSNKFALDHKKAEKKAKETMKKDQVKKVKIEDIQDEIPAEIYNKSVLF